MRFTFAGDITIEEALRRRLREEDLELVNLEGDGDLYAWYASNDSNEKVQGRMKRVAQNEYEMEMTPVLYDVIDPSVDPSSSDSSS